MNKIEDFSTGNAIQMEQELKIQFLLDSVKVSYDCMFSLFFKWRSQLTSASEEDIVAQCLFQMMLCNTKSILALFEGIKLTPKESIAILDPISMISILRSIYERTYIFHNVFVEPESIIEKRILFILWQIRGLNNRQKLGEIPTKYIDKQKKEKLDIETLKQEAIKLLADLQIRTKAKNKIIDEVKSDSSSIKGYQFIKNSKGYISDFKTISLTSSPKELFEGNGFSTIYKLLSWHTHPSYLGVLQFGQMFDMGEDKTLASVVLQSIVFFHSKFINDFLSVVDGAEDVFKSLPEQEKVAISIIKGLS